MGESAEARLSALERNDATQDRQISELFQRVNRLETTGAAQAATQAGMQTDISEAKAAAQASVEKLDALKMWMLGIAASTLASVVLSIVLLAMTLATKK